jgi:hypothetical protein
VGNTAKERIKILQSGLTGRDCVLVGHEGLSILHLGRALTKVSWGAILLDEGSRFRNWSIRTRTLLKLEAERKYVFTGTPIVKSPMDVWYPMTWLKPGWSGITSK